MKSGLGFVFEEKTVKAAEIENFQPVHRTEVERMHQGGGFGECECAAFGKDGTDELGTEIAVGTIQRDAQMTEKEAEDAVGIVFTTLEHIIYERFGTGINFFRYIQPKKSAGDIALFPIKSAVDMFFHESGGKGDCGIFPGKAVQYRQFTVKSEGNMSKRFTRE